MANRNAMTLIEVMAALIIAATVATIGIQYLKPADATSKQRSCDLTRELLQTETRRYYDTNGRYPSSDLRELRSNDYFGRNLPRCPVTSQAYELRGGRVECAEH